MNQPTGSQDKNRSVVEVERIPIVEEKLETGKTVRDGRTVTVHTRVQQEDVEITDDLRRETVEVRRVPVGRVVDTVAQPREVDGVTIVPVYEERLVVRRELVLVEEVHLVRTTTKETVTRTVSRAFTEVEIDEE